MIRYLNANIYLLNHNISLIHVQSILNIKNMKSYCIGLFFIVFIALTVVPAFFFYATNNLAQTDIFTRPGWLYGLALVTAITSAFICEMKTNRQKKKSVTRKKLNRVQQRHHLIETLTSAS